MWRHVQWVGGYPERWGKWAVGPRNSIETAVVTLAAALRQASHATLYCRGDPTAPHGH